MKQVKKAKFNLGVADSKLGNVIQEETGIPCVCNETVGEVLRGIRQHFAKFVKDLSELDMQRAQLGLAHSYSRAKVTQCCYSGLQIPTHLLNSSLRFSSHYL